ncbi:MAG: adenylate kinase [Fimbriimonadales bacterium]|nr:adenylate kinase [Fimbriimonadales bacterium]
MRILLVGPPGVGKGTQAALLQQRHGALHISSGEIFRTEMKAETELGKLAKSYMERGELVPDEVTIRMMATRLDTPEVREKGFILDGFPRTVAQAQALDEWFGQKGVALDAVIALEAGDDEVVRRLSGRLTCRQCGAIYHRDNHPPQVPGVCDACGGELYVRKDDREETIRERLRVYHETTKPVIGYYEQQGIVRRIEALEVESTYAKIKAALGL